MSTFYCLTDKSLRSRIEVEGIAAHEGEGFYLLPDMPEFDGDFFDLWTVEAPFADIGTPQMVSHPIAPEMMMIAEPALTLAF